jgi:phage terminase large subunit-like protein
MVEEITFDPWKSAGIEQELDNYGAEITRFPQTIGQFTMPMNEFEAAIVAGRVHHADNPVLNWMLSNLQAKRDTNGNVKPRKEDKKKKIDGIVAAIMGIGRCMQTEDEDYSAELIII